MHFLRMAILLTMISTWLIQCKGKTDSKGIVKLSDSIGEVIKTSDTSIQDITHPMSGIVFDSADIPPFLARYTDFKEFSKDITIFYKNRAYNYAWFDKDGLGEPAHVLMNKLKQETIDGIAVNAPYKEILLEMFNTNMQNNVKPDPGMELMLTCQYLHLAKKIWAGAYSNKLEAIGWNIPRKKISYEELLEKSVDMRNLPKIEEEILNPEYIALRGALKQYQELEKNPLILFIFQSLKNRSGRGILPLYCPR